MNRKEASVRREASENRVFLPKLKKKKSFSLEKIKVELTWVVRIDATRLAVDPPDVLWVKHHHLLVDEVPPKVIVFHGAAAHRQRSLVLLEDPAASVGRPELRVLSVSPDVVRHNCVPPLSSEAKGAWPRLWLSGSAARYHNLVPDLFCCRTLLCYCVCVRPEPSTMLERFRFSSPLPLVLLFVDVVNNNIYLGFSFLKHCPFYISRLEHNLNNSIDLFTFKFGWTNIMITKKRQQYTIWEALLY